MAFIRFLAAAGAITWLLAAPAEAQQQVRCSSRDYQYQFCGAGDNVIGVSLVSQFSRTSCVEGRTWGWNNRGVWVNNGCDAMFRVDARPAPPPPGGGTIRVQCDSRNYQYRFCNLDQRVVSVELVRQNSQAACVFGRTWGWRGDGIWVNEGCEGEFVAHASYRPLPQPARPGLVYCESHEYRYNFCPTGPIRDAQLVEQRSRAPCIRGQTWGVEREGVWVDNGCEGAFNTRRR
jgi:hypothetical protein